MEAIPMNSMLLNIIIQTMPKVDANRYEEGRIIVKPRSKWKSDAITGFSLCLLCIVAIILTDKLPVPYLGGVLFIGGFFGLVYALLFGFRALMVYKYYYDIYKEEDLKKLEE